MKKALLISALAVALLLSVVAFATADVATYGGSGVSTASGVVTAKVTVRPKITLTINTPDAGQTADFGTVDPGTAAGGKTVNLSVDSNKAFTLSKAVAGQTAEMGFSSTLAASSAGAKGQNQTFSDDYSINVPWSTEPGNYASTITYTVTQN